MELEKLDAWRPLLGDNMSDSPLIIKSKEFALQSIKI